MNKKRLLKLADFVATIPRNEFEMWTFWLNGPCGTVGCAIGHAARAGLFRELTFHPRSHTSRGRVRSGRHYGLHAAIPVFGIDEAAAERLFLEHYNHRTPIQVARNIRRYVETGKLP